MLQSGLSASINITATMERVAEAMTNHIRNLSTLVVPGQSGSMEVYIYVSWQWLILPALSVIFGVILLVAAIEETKRHQIHVWKTSGLALLFHSLDAPIDDAGSMYKISDMEDIAAGIQVKLGKGDKGGLLLEQKSGRSASIDFEMLLQIVITVFCNFQNIIPHALFCSLQPSFTF